MRAVVQRVTAASVSVQGDDISSIGKGLLVLVGIHRDDGDEDMDYLARKIMGLRIFDDEAGVMNRSVADIGGEVLLVSQFTLYGDARRGKRPSYAEAMTPGGADDFFKRFVERCRGIYGNIQTGRFGAEMELSLVNWGPVTILLDSARTF